MRQHETKKITLHNCELLDLVMPWGHFSSISLQNCQYSEINQPDRGIKKI